MVEYGVNVTNKFDFLSDDEVEDPEMILRKAEALSKNGKTASQKKADRNAAAKKKKENAAAAAAAAAAAVTTAAATVTSVTRDTDTKKFAITGKKADFGKENKENRPEGERGRGRGRGRGGFTRGRGGGAPFGGPRANIQQNGDRDVIGERFGEGRGRGRGRGGRGRFPFRGGRGGARPVDGNQENNMDDTQSPPEGGQITVNFGGDQNINGFGGNFRGSFRGGRGGFRGGDRDNERPAFRGGRGGRGARQFDRMSGSDRTGIKSFDKKDGFGKGNWGTGNDDLDGQNERLNTSFENEKMDDPVVPREKNDEEVRMEAEEETVSKQLTLDEFKAQMAARRSEPQFNIRQAGEGTNEKDFGKLVPLSKPVVKEPSGEEVVVVRREPRIKRLDIEINFTDEQRSGRGGRTRDGFRGGRGSRGGRDGRGPRATQTFEVSADAFPALGSH